MAHWRGFAVLLLLLLATAASAPAISAVRCDEIPICDDGELSALNGEIARREQSLAVAAMHPALRGEIGQSAEDWGDSLAECMTANDVRACYRTRLVQRLDVMVLLDRLFAGPRLAGDPAAACTARRQDIPECASAMFTTADTVFGIMSRALATFPSVKSTG